MRKDGQEVVYTGAGGGGGAATIADGSDVAQGATADAAVVNPALAATEIALLKGHLTELLAILAGVGAKADAAETNWAAEASLIGCVKGVIQLLRTEVLTSVADGKSETLGAKADAAVVDPSAAASLIALAKGLLTGQGANADAAVTDPSAAASVIALAKGLLTALGTKTDTAKPRYGDTDTAMAFLKGIVQLLTPGAGGTGDTATATAGAATITYNAVANRRHVVTSVSWSYSGSDTLPSKTAPGTLTINVGGQPVHVQKITDPGAGFVSLGSGIATGDNVAMTIVLASGGASVVGYVNAAHRLE